MYVYVTYPIKQLELPLNIWMGIKPQNNLIHGMSTGLTLNSNLNLFSFRLYSGALSRYIFNKFLDTFSLRQSAIKTHTMLLHTADDCKAPAVSYFLFALKK